MCQAAKGDTGLQENPSPSLPCRRLQVSVRMLRNLGWVLEKLHLQGGAAPEQVTREAGRDLHPWRVSKSGLTKIGHANLTCH